MGEVISFRSPSRRRAGNAPPEGPAQILFFLGVRYQRQEKDDDVDFAGANPGPRRAGGASVRPRRRKRA